MEEEAEGEKLDVMIPVPPLISHTCRLLEINRDYSAERSRYPGGGYLLRESVYDLPGAVPGGEPSFYG